MRKTTKGNNVVKGYWIGTLTFTRERHILHRAHYDDGTSESTPDAQMRLPKYSIRIW